jgi:hypothetical protein
MRVKVSEFDNFYWYGVNLREEIGAKFEATYYTIVSQPHKVGLAQ